MTIELYNLLYEWFLPLKDLMTLDEFNALVTLCFLFVVFWVIWLVMRVFAFVFGIVFRRF